MVKKTTLSELDKLILEEIEKFIVKNCYAPTNREIAALVNINSTSTIFSHLNFLKSMGYISYRDKEPRTIVLLHKEYILRDRQKLGKDGECDEQICGNAH